ncbi:aminoglycoside N(3)-acetyltransferase [Devosia nitrariae]|uniref:Aminoglycoside N(3)-acetyltransferase n=1 Tax=Devosia nitrariae TaxID=2071872 RepID=A0ABQ5WB56_9HYPH|nr:AAC(3) family N-acetyltransferase [Devosia nitrariae]GLQ57192.1 aminoglycoside 3-N-acetyltransferase [Devosia nitrariae]
MIDRQELAQQLRALGVGGGALMVHASLRRLGTVAGGADGVLDALQEALAPDGTLLMMLGADASVPFDAATTPADPEMGVLAETFRRRPGVRVNDHAASRYAAIGPLAAPLLEPMPLHDYHGPRSVLERLVEIGGAVLRLGADTDTMTLTHYAEYLAELPEKRRSRLRYLRADIGEQWIESLDDTDGIADWENGGDDDYFARILIDFLATGKARTGLVGRCNAELVPARDFVEFATTWMEDRLG